MICNPQIYENEILIARKRELDVTFKEEIGREINRIKGQISFPIFEIIEVETFNRCNGSCAFCPVNCHDDTRQPTKMSETLFQSVICQLERLEYKGRLDLFSNNEPLLDSRIADFSKYAYQHLPNAYRTIFTNGTLLNVDLLLELVKYLDLLCIDIYYDEIENALSENLRETLSYCVDKPEIEEKVMIQLISKRAIRNNRGGQSKNCENVYHLEASCLLPFIQMVVRPDGKISLCCNDPLGKNTLGDLNDKSIIEVWRGKVYNEYREKIAQGRSMIPLCENCDNFSTINWGEREVFSDVQRKESWMRIQEIL